MSENNWNADNSETPLSLFEYVPYSDGDLLECSLETVYDGLCLFLRCTYFTPYA